MEGYYYRAMSREEQAVYYAMKAGLLALSPAISLPALPYRQLSDILFRLRLDLPELFWVEGFQTRARQGADSLQMIPNYLFDKNKIREHQRALASRREKLVRPARDLSPLERERYVHDWVCGSVRYDKLKKSYSHEIIGPLGQGVGVCEGIAKSVKYLCDALDLECIIVISQANPDKHIRYRHAWNILTVGGVRYHLDATFDNSLGKKGSAETGDKPVIRYDYFNLGDRGIFRDHQPLIYPAPPCPENGKFYYKEKKLSFTKPEEVENRARQALRKKVPLVFHWRGGFLSREILRDLTLRLEGIASEKGRCVLLRVNRPQAVLEVHFPEKQAPPDVILQEANEAEADADAGTPEA